MAHGVAGVSVHAACSSGTSSMGSQENDGVHEVGTAHCTTANTNAHRSCGFHKQRGTHLNLSRYHVRDGTVLKSGFERLIIQQVWVHGNRVHRRQRAARHCEFLGSRKFIVELKPEVLGGWFRGQGRERNAFSEIRTCDLAN
ncbi:hypothetical protein DFH07DRAFT_764828 [Mycena maculata]|uniref:Uncharacterized protein n=1 Tax=Mycena maculata TaxID=230809 RepID=A0AAD7NZ92_9AGAR|nr:hypothetical protein DFH07DRAFT_764828 [Mycena maculata]